MKMLRLGAQQLLRYGGGRSMVLGGARTQSSAPEKIEVFIDDKPVMVEPGTTVLQVSFFMALYLPYCFV